MVTEDSVVKGTTSEKNEVSVFEECSIDQFDWI